MMAVNSYIWDNYLPFHRSTEMVHKIVDPCTERNVLILAEFADKRNRENFIKVMRNNHVGARRARLCVWAALTNIIFIDESMAVHNFFF